MESCGLLWPVLNGLPKVPGPQWPTPKESSPVWRSFSIFPLKTKNANTSELQADLPRRGSWQTPQCEKTAENQRGIETVSHHSLFATSAPLSSAKLHKVLFWESEGVGSLSSTHPAFLDFFLYWFSPHATCTMVLDYFKLLCNILNNLSTKAASWDLGVLDPLYFCFSYGFKLYFKQKQRNKQTKPWSLFSRNIVLVRPVVETDKNGAAVVRRAWKGLGFHLPTLLSSPTLIKVKNHWPVG